MLCHRTADRIDVVVAPGETLVAGQIQDLLAEHKATGKTVVIERPDARLRVTLRMLGLDRVFRLVA